MPRISFEKLRKILLKKNNEENLQSKGLSEALGFAVGEIIGENQLEKIQWIVTNYRKNLLENLEKTSLVSSFEFLNLKYRYFSEKSEACKVFTEMELIGRVLNNIKDSSKVVQDLTIIHNVYELMVLFGGEFGELFYKNLDAFYTRNFGNIDEFFSAAKDFKITPCDEVENPPYDLTRARQLLKSKKDGVKVAKNFDMMHKFKSIPNDVKSFKEKLFYIKYPDAQRDFALANLCDSLGADNFLPILKGRDTGFIPTEPKSEDYVPNIHVSFKSGSSKYHLVKIPETNPRILQLGNYVGNCQSWPSKYGGPDVSNVIYDGMHNKSNGFYIIVKESTKQPFELSHLDNLEAMQHELVGQSPVWIGMDNSIILGVLAVKSARAKNLDVMEIMKSFGMQAETLGFDRIIVGGTSEIQGIRSLEDLDSNHTEFNSVACEGYKYAHILYQQEAYISKKLCSARKDLAEITRLENQSHITSVAQAKAVKEALDKNSALKEVVNYFNYTNCYVMRNWDVDKLLLLIEKFEALKNQNPDLYKKLFDFNNKINFHPGTHTKEYIAYKYGVTVESICELPENIIDLILYDELVKNSIVRLSKMDKFLDSIKMIDSPLSLKQQLVKAYARDLCKDDGDLGYIDEISNIKKLDKILYSYCLFLFGFAKIRELISFDEDLFDYVINDLNYLQECFIYGTLPCLSDMDHSSLDSLRKSALSNIIASKSLLDKNYNKFGESIVKILSEINLKVFSSPLALDAWHSVDSLDQLITDPKEPALNIQRKILKLFSKDYRLDFEVIEARNQKYCDLIFSAHPRNAIYLFNTTIFNLYSRGKIDDEDIGHLDREMSSIISSSHILDILERPIKFYRSLTKEQISFLNCNSCLVSKLHKAGKLDINAIAAHTPDKIDQLLSEGMLDLVEGGLATFDMLLKFDATQLSIIENTHIIDAIKKGELSIEGLQDCSADSIQALQGALYEDEYFDLDHLVHQNVDMIKVILDCNYYIKDLGISLIQYELSKHSPEKIRYLFKEAECRVKYFCEDSGIDFFDFIDLDLNKIKILLQGWTASAVKNAGLDAKALAEIEISKLELILSDKVIEYTWFHDTSLADLAGMDEDDIREMVFSGELASQESVGLL